MSHLAQAIAIIALSVLPTISNSQEATVGGRELQADTAAISQMLDAKNAAVMALLHAMTKCQAKLKFYKPGSGADADGCVAPATATSGRLVRSFEAEVCPYGSCTTSNPDRTARSQTLQTPIADLCVISKASGYAGGLWGLCSITGAPGSTWRLTASQAGGSIVSCRVSCYQLQ